MRTIKFRGKTVRTGQWIFGSLVKNGEKTLIFPEDAPNSYDNYFVVPETVGQFIGQKDRNGAEIYKDDLLKVWCLPFADAEEEIAKVTWDEKRAGFILLYNNGSYHYFYDVMEVEVVGNIHDTKLEDKK